MIRGIVLFQNLFNNSPFSLPLFPSFPPPHYTTLHPHHNIFAYNPRSYHTSYPDHTQRDPLFPFPSLFPFVCGVGVVRGMSLGCEWMCCSAGCGVVRVPFPFFFSFPSFSI